ncbi:MAG: molybdenum cofactor biosynthesis protein MoaE [Rhizomicrobium sp.]
MNVQVTIRIQEDDFDLNREADALAGDGQAGAVVSFVGRVRKEGDLSILRLEHYPKMTEAEIGRMVEEAGDRWSLLGVTVIHRVGALAPGARIVLAMVASSHRHAAFEACQFLMDYLKTKAPFWKEEMRGTARHWVEQRASDDQAATRWRKN